MRTRILPKMLNSEVQEYLKRNDIIIMILLKINFILYHFHLLNRYT